MQSEFMVVFSKKGDVVFFVGGGFIMILLILPIFHKGQALLSTITAIILIFLICLVVMASVLFHVIVKNSTINVRTRLGRKYNFNCSEIEKVTCSDKRLTIYQ